MIQLKPQMSRRKVGQRPYISAHPVLINMPDIPGHRQRGSGKTVNKEIKQELELQIERLRREILVNKESVEGIRRERY